MTTATPTSPCARPAVLRALTVGALSACLVAACLLAGATTARADDAPPSSANEPSANEPSAKERAAQLPISSPRSAPRAGSIPVAGAVPDIQRRTWSEPTSQATRTSARTATSQAATERAASQTRAPSRWPANARPFVASTSSRPSAAQTAPAQRAQGSPDLRAPGAARIPVQRVARTDPRLRAPEVRRTSPSYAELARTQPSSVLARPAADPRATPPGASTFRASRRAPARRSAPARRAAAPRRTDPAPTPVQALTVPLAPGQQPPAPPTRRRMDFRPPPGCSAYG